MGDKPAPPPGPDRLPWERQPSESPQAHDGFVVYLDLGAGRSLRQAAATLKKNKSLLERWSSRHDWVTRAGAYDAHMLRRRLEAREESLVAAEARRNAIGDAIDRALLSRLEGDAANDVPALSPGDMDWQDIARLRRVNATAPRPSPRPPDDGEGAGMVPALEAAEHIRAVFDLARRRMSEEDFETLRTRYKEVADAIGFDPPADTPDLGA